MIGRPRTVRVAPPAPPSSPPGAAAALAAAPAAGARPPPASDPAPAVLRAPVAAFPCTYARSFFDGSRGDTSPSWLSDFVDETYRMCVSGSYDPPGQLVPPPAAEMASVASGPSTRLTTGGVKIGP